MRSLRLRWAFSAGQPVLLSAVLFAGCGGSDSNVDSGGDTAVHLSEASSFDLAYGFDMAVDGAFATSQSLSIEIITSGAGATLSARLVPASGVAFVGTPLVSSSDATLGTPTLVNGAWQFDFTPPDAARSVSIAVSWAVSVASDGAVVDAAGGTFDASVGAADGGVAPYSVTIPLSYCSTGWLAQDPNVQCAIVCEMAPSPSLGSADLHALPLGEALDCSLLPIARVGRSVVLRAQHNGQPGTALAMAATGGQLVQLADDVWVWTTESEREQSLAVVTATMETASAMAVASWSWERWAAC